MTNYLPTFQNNIRSLLIFLLAHSKSQNGIVLCQFFNLKKNKIKKTSRLAHNSLKMREGGGHFIMERLA